MDEINRISRVDFVPEGTRTTDLPTRKKAGKLKHSGMDMDEFNLQTEPVPGGEDSSSDVHLDING